MSEVEDVAGCRAERIEHVPRLLAHTINGRSEPGGVEIALQRDLVADAAAGFGGIHGPVESDRIAAGSRDGLEPDAAAAREENRKHAPAIGLAPERREHAPRVRQRGL